MPPIVTINLKTLLATSKLGEAGGFGPFPDQTILAYNVSRQARGLVPANGPALANGPAPANGAALANVSLTAQTAQTERSTTVANNNSPSQSTGAPTATGSPPETTGSGTGRDRGNNSNIRNMWPLCGRNPSTKPKSPRRSISFRSCRRTGERRQATWLCLRKMDTRHPARQRGQPS